MPLRYSRVGIMEAGDVEVIVVGEILCLVRPIRPLAVVDVSFSVLFAPPLGHLSTTKLPANQPTEH